MMLSIVTVCLDNLQGLLHTADSIAEQQPKFSMEWIVVDGGSTDGTAQFLKGLSLPYLRWTSEPDRGLYDAMNKGIDAAKGELLLFLNSGDVFVGGLLDRLELRPCLLPVRTTSSLTGRTIWHKIRDCRYALPNCHQGIIFPRTAARYDLAYRVAADYKFFLDSGLRNELQLADVKPAHVFFERGGLSSTQRKLGEAELARIVGQYFGPAWQMRARAWMAGKNLVRYLARIVKRSAGSAHK